MDRYPVVSGQFYPGTRTALVKELGSLVPDHESEDCIAAVMPHAGYIYSGQVAGETCARIDVPDTVIILGTNHTGRGAAVEVYSWGSWKTPLGDAFIEDRLAKDLLGREDFISSGNLSHKDEHSIEVILPFLMYRREGLRIVPVTVSQSDPDTYRRLGEAIAASVRAFEKRVLVIASTDMTHYMPGDMAGEQDRAAIDAVLKLDAGLLLKTVTERRISMCGIAPVCTMIHCAGSLGAKEAELVKYMTSGDVTGDYQSVVGYAGIIIR